jgi:hypothetical protein
VVDGGARAVEIGHGLRAEGGGLSAQRLIPPAEGQTHAILVARIAHTGEAKAHEFFQPRHRGGEQFGGGLLQVGRTLVEVEFAALEKEVGMRINQTGKQRGVGRDDIGCGLAGTDERRRRSPSTAADKTDAGRIIDDVCIPRRCGAGAVEQRANMKPDRVFLGTGNGDDHLFQGSIGAWSLQMAMMASAWR